MKQINRILILITLFISILSPININAQKTAKHTINQLQFNVNNQQLSIDLHQHTVNIVKYELIFQTENKDLTATLTYNDATKRYELDKKILIERNIATIKLKKVYALFNNKKVEININQPSIQTIWKKQSAVNESSLAVQQTNLKHHLSTTDGKETVVKQKTAVAKLKYSVHTAVKGWLKTVEDNQIGGTVGESRQLEAIKLNIAGIKGSIHYSSHTSTIGWLNEVKDGEIAGTTARSLAIEAIKVRLSGEIEKYYDIYYRVHTTRLGWLGWAKNNEIAGTQGLSLRAEAVQMKLVKKGDPVEVNVEPTHYIDNLPIRYYQPKINYAGKSQSRNNFNYTDNGIVGTQGQSLRLEDFKAYLENVPKDSGIEYQAHYSNLGWLNYKSNQQPFNVKNEQIEALKIRLTGSIAQHYDIYYRSHIENLGWLAWTKNGKSSGSEGLSYRMEAVEIKLVPKTTIIDTVGIAFHTKNQLLQNIPELTYRLKTNNNWSSKYSTQQIIGEPNSTKLIQDFLLQFDNQTHNIAYSGHFANVGWVNEKRNGQTFNQVTQLEAVKIRLQNGLDKLYDIYYRTNVDGYGWLGWAKNGESSGTEGLSKRVVAVEIRIVLKNQSFNRGSKQPFLKKRRIVFIDPGHGGEDPGAVVRGVNEKDNTLDVYKRLKNLLETNGYIVKTSREDDSYVDFKTERSIMANNSGAEIFISLHFNVSGLGYGPSGIETYINRYEKEYPPIINHQYHMDPVRISNSNKLAQIIQKNVVKQSRLPDRGVHRESFAVIRETVLPAILLEMGYLDNDYDRSLIKTAEYRQRLAVGIFNGIKEYFGD